ncbi:MAG TPA: hypothetical protein VM489_05120 [Burkholderiales bacterium]|nr:hypothetical protein [Burkholderiales bacterium]
MEPQSEKPLRLFVNPLAVWTELALKTGEMLVATVHAAAVRANDTNAPRVAVLPTADAPPRRKSRKAESRGSSSRRRKRRAKR